MEFQLCDLFHFPRGLPGLEEEVSFFAVSIPGQEPLMYLQSTRTPGLCLITLPARACRQDYSLELSPDEKDLLGILASTTPRIGIEVACQVIVTVDERREPVANLAAPLVLNLATRLATQSFQAMSDYSFRHLISDSVVLQPCS